MTPRWYVAEAEFAMESALSKENAMVGAVVFACAVEGFENVSQ